jgi:hypothetical protein
MHNLKSQEINTKLMDTIEMNFLLPESQVLDD